MHSNYKFTAYITEKGNEDYETQSLCGKIFLAEKSFYWRQPKMIPLFLILLAFIFCKE